MSKNDLLSIKQFAERAGKSPQAIYKQLDSRLNSYVQLVDNRQMLESRALQEIYGIKNEQPNELEFNNKLNREKEDEIQFLRVRVQNLEAELKKERDHNREKDRQLLETLSKLADSQNYLVAGQTADKQRALVSEVNNAVSQEDGEDVSAELAEKWYKKFMF